jgi:hypothetical protein
LGGEGATFCAAIGGLDSSFASGSDSGFCASAVGAFVSVGMPGEVTPCWSRKPPIGFLPESGLFAPHSPISPLEPDMGGDAVSAAAGNIGSASTKNTPTNWQAWLMDPRRIHNLEKNDNDSTNKVPEKP